MLRANNSSPVLWILGLIAKVVAAMTLVGLAAMAANSVPRSIRL